MGDLFTVMESWEDPTQTKDAMDVILGIEAEAASRVSCKQGLVKLLRLLRHYQVRAAGPAAGSAEQGHGWQGRGVIQGRPGLCEVRAWSWQDV